MQGHHTFQVIHRQRRDHLPLKLPSHRQRGARSGVPRSLLLGEPRACINARNAEGRYGETYLACRQGGYGTCAPSENAIAASVAAASGFSASALSPRSTAAASALPPPSPPPTGMRFTISI